MPQQDEHARFAAGEAALLVAVAWFNIAGLALDIIGAWLVYLFAIMGVGGGGEGWRPDKTCGGRSASGVGAVGGWSF